LAGNTLTCQFHIDLDEYRSLVHIDEPFQAPNTRGEVEKDELVHKLSAYLQSEAVDKHKGSDFSTIPYS